MLTTFVSWEGTLKTPPKISRNMTCCNTTWWFSAMVRMQSRWWCAFQGLPVGGNRMVPEVGPKQWHRFFHSFSPIIVWYISNVHFIEDMELFQWKPRNLEFQWYFFGEQILTGWRCCLPCWTSSPRHWNDGEQMMYFPSKVMRSKSINWMNEVYMCCIKSYI